MIFVSNESVTFCKVQFHFEKKGGTAAPPTKEGEKQHHPGQREEGTTTNRRRWPRVSERARKRPKITTGRAQNDRVPETASKEPKQTRTSGDQDHFFENYTIPMCKIDRQNCDETYPGTSHCSSYPALFVDAFWLSCSPPVPENRPPTV